MEEKDIPRAQMSHKRGSRVLLLGLGLMGGHAESSWRFPGQARWEAGRQAGWSGTVAGMKNLQGMNHSLERFRFPATCAASDIVGGWRGS